jgi:MFS family permease
MLSQLYRLFRIVPGEGAKVLAFAALAALMQAGVAIGQSAADSLFLIHLGVEKLPLIFICLPVVMTIYAPIFAILQTRFGPHRVFIGTLVLLAAGGVFFGLGGDFIGENTPWFLFTMKLYVGMWFVAIYTLFWNFADDYFNILDSKRLYGLIAAGAAGGAMIGSFLVTLFTSFFPPAKLFLVWTALALITVPVFSWLKRRFPRIETELSVEEESMGAGRLLGFVLRTFKSSRFALALSAICFCMVCMSGVMEYLAFSVISQENSAADLAGLLGKLYAIANAATIIINLVIFNRIVGRIGVNNTALILPLAYLSAFVLFFLKGGLLGALVCFYVYQSLMVSVEYNNVNLLFNALPAGVKRQLRTFIEAMCEPVATALAGVFLLAWAAPLGGANVALVGILAAIVTVGVALLVRHDYLHALAENLRRDWLDFTHSTKVWLGFIRDPDRVLLREKATQSQDRSEKILAAEILGYMDDPGACEALLNIVATARPSEADRLRPAIRRMIQSGDTAIVARTLMWMESSEGPEEPELLDEFTAAGVLPIRHLNQWRNSRHPSRMAMAAISRWYSSRIEDTQGALAEVCSLLQGDPATRRWGVRALGTFRHAHHARELLRFLREPDQELKIETLRALHRMAGPDSGLILESVLPLLPEATPDERGLILGIASKVGDESAVEALLMAAELFTAAESRHLEELILGMGLKTVPCLIHHLRNTAVSSHSRAIAARTLGKMAMPQLELIADELIEGGILRAQECALAARSIETNRPSEGSDGLLVLEHYYRDSAMDSLEFILQLLSLTGRLPDFDLIRASLAFANLKDRANAIETIEQSCPRALFERLLPLIELTGTLRRRKKDGGLPSRSLSDILKKAAESDYALECGPALLAAFDLHMPEAQLWLQRRLSLTRSQKVMDWLMAFQSSGAPRPATDGSEPVMHPLSRLASLVRANLFEGARLFALDYLASRSTVVALVPGPELYTSVNPSSDLYVVASGSLELIRPHGNYLLKEGACCNEQVLMGTIRREEQARSLGCVVIELPGATVAKAIEVFPALGISLFKAKIVPAIP